MRKFQKVFRKTHFEKYLQIAAFEISNKREVYQ